MDKLISYLGFLSGLIGLILAVLFYFKSRREKKIYILKKTFELLTKPSDLPKLDILYDGKKVDKLIITRFAIINGGNETINYSDISKQDPLRITTPLNSQIFDARILFENKPSNLFSISQNNNTVSVNFDFIDVADGTILQIIHDLTDSDNIRFLGTIKGARIVNMRLNKINFYKYLIYIILLLGLGMFCFYFGYKMFFGLKPYFAIPILIIIGGIPALFVGFDNKFFRSKYFTKFEKFI